MSSYHFFAMAPGGDFKLSKVKGDIKQLMVSVAGKLIICPLCIITAGILLGFHNEVLVPILLMSWALLLYHPIPWPSKWVGIASLQEKL